jgi:competence protein ComEA
LLALTAIPWCRGRPTTPLALPRYRPDLNRAPARHLRLIRGIGPSRSRALVLERQKGGPFATFEEVARRVRGIGPGLVECLRQETHLAAGRDAVEFIE